MVLDDDVFKTGGNFHRRGGKPMLQRTFDDNLDSVLDKFSDYIWDELARGYHPRFRRMAAMPYPTHT